MARAGRDKRHVTRETAQEQRFAHSVVAGADHADTLVGHLIAVADRAIAQQATLERLVVQSVIDGRTVVLDAGGEQDGAGGERRVVWSGAKLESTGVVACEMTDAQRLAHDTEAFGLLQHSCEELGTRNAAGVAGMVVGARDQRGTAGAAVEQPNGKMEPRQIDRGGESSRPAADDDTVFHWPAERVGRRFVPRRPSVS